MQLAYHERCCLHMLLAYMNVPCMHVHAAYSKAALPF